MILLNRDFDRALGDNAGRLISPVSGDKRLATGCEYKPPEAAVRMMDDVGNKFSLSDLLKPTIHGHFCCQADCTFNRLAPDFVASRRTGGQNSQGKHHKVANSSVGSPTHKTAMLNSFQHPWTLKQVQGDEFWRWNSPCLHPVISASIAKHRAPRLAQRWWSLPHRRQARQRSCADGDARASTLSHPARHSGWPELHRLPQD